MSPYFVFFASPQSALIFIEPAGGEGSILEKEYGRLTLWGFASTIPNSEM
jgi:hypothetical protein